jgi:hypothetical protein
MNLFGENCSQFKQEKLRLNISDKQKEFVFPILVLQPKSKVCDRISGDD